MRTYLPLGVSYARTIHKFQGLSAGDVDPGKIPNMYKTIICDPDKKDVEGRCPGLLYTALSRATTLGDSRGIGSALYFDGIHFNYERIKHLTRKQNVTERYERVIKREQWVNHLKDHMKNAPSHSKDGARKESKEALKLFHWAKHTRYTCEELDSRIDSFVRFKVALRNNQTFGL